MDIPALANGAEISRTRAPEEPKRESSTSCESIWRAFHRSGETWTHVSSKRSRVDVRLPGVVGVRTSSGELALAVSFLICRRTRRISRRAISSKEETTWASAKTESSSWLHVMLRKVGEGRRSCSTTWCVSSGSLVRGIWTRERVTGRMVTVAWVVLGCIRGGKRNWASGRRRYLASERMYGINTLCTSVCPSDSPVEKPLSRLARQRSQ